MSSKCVHSLGSHGTDALPSEHRVGVEVSWLETSVDSNLLDPHLTLSTRCTLGLLVEPEEVKNATNEGNQIFHQLVGWGSMENIIVKNKFQAYYNSTIRGSVCLDNDQSRVQNEKNTLFIDHEN